MNFDWFVIKYQNFETNNPNLQIVRINFVYHRWGCKEIYRLLSYRLMSLAVMSRDLGTNGPVLLELCYGVIYYLRGYAACAHQ